MAANNMDCDIHCTSGDYEPVDENDGDDDDDGESLTAGKKSAGFKGGGT